MVFQITREDNLPTKLCLKCAEIVIKFGNLAEKAVESENKLKQIFADFDLIERIKPFPIESTSQITCQVS